MSEESPPRSHLIVSFRPAELFVVDRGGDRGVVAADCALCNPLAQLHVTKIRSRTVK
jgi:hypothetical protein